MKGKDLRERSVEDLRELEKSLAKDTFQNRFKNFTNRLDDTSLLNKTKRDLARVKTILRQMEVAAQIKAETGVDLNPAHAAAEVRKASRPKAKKMTAKAKAASGAAKTAKTSKPKKAAKAKKANENQEGAK
jgi:large subunit ribosomal protein L29